MALVLPSGVVSDRVIVKTYLIIYIDNTERTESRDNRKLSKAKQRKISEELKLTWVKNIEHRSKDDRGQRDERRIQH